jgi:two-component system NtrC family response regulator
LGAFDYLPKPFTPEELSLAVGRAVEDPRLRREDASTKRELVQLVVRSTLIGRSRAMEDLLAHLRRVAPTDFTVCLCGESGTGKELAARSVHDLSRRRGMPFVAVDLSALSPGLVESELFGHVRGAFTGATQGRPGYFVIARGGTLFLDEISNMPLELQGKLLRAIESRRIHALGSERDVEIDIRLVVATNQDLEELVRAGRFREDLFYRLNVIPLRLPPLRDRPEDIPLLALHFLEEARRAAPSGPRGSSAEAMARLLAHRWPGNVRELRNLVERLVATLDVDLVRLENLPAELRSAPPSPADTDAAPQTAEELKRAKRRLKDAAYANVEKGFLLHALESAGSNVTHAAQNAGMARPNFHALMRKYGIRARGEELEDGRTRHACSMPRTTLPSKRWSDLVAIMAARLSREWAAYLQAARRCWSWPGHATGSTHRASPCLLRSHAHERVAQSRYGSGSRRTPFGTGASREDLTDAQPRPWPATRTSAARLPSQHRLADDGGGPFHLREGLLELVEVGVRPGFDPLGRLDGIENALLLLGRELSLEGLDRPHGVGHEPVQLPYHRLLRFLLLLL